jgi:acetyl-CoA carboxylase, biotin carboxylase subunit
MFQKILIANRGEISLRIIRACKELDIRTVAVYSEADSNSQHVRAADEAYEIGPAPATESYLSIERIIDVALRTGTEAIHPGYGFLSENEQFARAVNEAGIVFIGPTADAIRKMGSKVEARQLAASAGVPLIPGSEQPIKTVEELRALTATLGLPIMLKAVSGGGGKGMRIVTKDADLESSFHLARSEAESSFKDSSVYIEKAVTRPRHIEVQVFADQMGNVVHLGERECSIQRRHQKVVEESPSPISDPALRERMGEAAIRLAQKVNYIGAGTVEFLVSDESREFYFLEMNTRLQVEHPVTEFVTGIDLVREQIRVSYGLPLSFTQSDILPRGSAIECRVYAEDPLTFLPSAGQIRHLRLPSGPGIRIDGALSSGDIVSIYYDPMLAKLISFGRTREEAIDKLRVALDEFEVTGIQTNLPLFRRIVRNEDFLAGRLDTGFLSRMGEEKDQSELDEELAIIAASLRFLELTTRPVPKVSKSNWRTEGRQDQFRSKLASG